MSENIEQATASPGEVRHLDQGRKVLFLVAIASDGATESNLDSLDANEEPTPDQQAVIERLRLAL